MTEPTLAEAIEKLVMFAGVPDPYGWSLDGQPVDLGALVVVVRDHVADLQTKIDAAHAESNRLMDRAIKLHKQQAEALALGERWRDKALDAQAESAEARALSEAMEGWREMAKEAQANTKRWRNQCPVTAEHVKAAGVPSAKAYAWQRSHRPACLPAPLATWTAVAMAINLWALAVCRPAHDILAEMAALDVPT